VKLQPVYLVGLSVNVILARHRGLVVNVYTNVRCLQYHNTWSNWS